MVAAAQQFMTEKAPYEDFVFEKIERMNGLRLKTKKKFPSLIPILVKS